MLLPSLYQIGDTVVIPESQETRPDSEPQVFDEELATVIGVRFRAVLVPTDEGHAVLSSRAFYDISFASDRDDIESLAEEYLRPGPNPGLVH